MYGVMDVSINLMGESFHNVYIYQVIPLNNLQFCQLYLNKAVKKWRQWVRLQL